ncbi:MAG: cell envelope integrity protein TolA [Prolixibacteraceae bacterium]|nr:cell envelope integrity protein TolA [Prolixibacteraceae bacterium]
MKYISEHRTGLIGTLVTHGVILIFLLYFGILITKPATPPFEEGILVNFGDSETGLGLEEPAPGEREPSVKPIESASEKVVLPPPPSKKVSSPDDDPIVTQDVEKTVAVKTPKKKAVEKVIDPEKQRLAEEERLQKAEQLRQQKEEQQRLAQAAAEQRKIGEINSRAKNVFGGGGKGSPDSKSTSQGITYGTGNQGVPQGSANAERYGPGGGIGNGVSFSLDGRTSQSLPKPRYPGNEEGVVVVQVTVNKSGQVTKAEAGVRGSNTADPELISAAKKAALQAKFNVDNNAPAYQTGTITYRFVLD